MRVRAVLLLGAVVALVSAIGVGGFGTDFIMLLNNQPPQIDPAKAASNPEMEIMLACYENLIVIDPETTKVVPVLATGWDSSADKTEWVIELRSGVKFHDGTSFDSTDVKVAVEREMAIGKGESYVFDNVDRVETGGELVVKFFLKKPQPEFILGMSRFFIPSSEAIAAHEKAGDRAEAWLAENAAGTGPYKFVTWDRGTQIILEKFEDYWRGWEGKHIDRFIMRNVPEPGTQFLMMQRGEGHYADNIVLEDAVKLRDNPALRVEAHKGDPMYMTINPTKGPLSNKLVREAIAHAFDYETFLETIMEGFAERLLGPVPGHIWGANTNLPPVQFDLQKSKQLLAQAGYPNGGFELSYKYFAPWLFERSAALILQENLKTLGIGMSIEGLPWATWTEMAGNPDTRADLGFAAVFSGNPTPSPLLKPIYHSGSEGHWAYWGYNNPAFDHILDAATQELNDDVRRRLYEFAQELPYYDYASLYIMQQPDIMVFKKEVGGFKYSHYFAKVVNYYGLYIEK